MFIKEKLDVVAAIIERQGKILLARRPMSADQPGKWEFAGGKLEAGETQQQAVTRELREELAIQARPGRFIASHCCNIAGREVCLHAWHVTHFTGEPTARFHAALHWCTPEEARDFDLAPADVPLLEAFIARPPHR